MDPARRQRPSRSRGNAGISRRFGLIVGALIAGTLGCSGAFENADQISSIEITLPANSFLEEGRSVAIRVVARNAAGDSVPATLTWRTADTAAIAIDTVRGVVTAKKAAGTANIQVGVFGKDTLISSQSAVTFTLTAPVDTLRLIGADSLDVAKDGEGAEVRVALEGGTPRAGVVGRPVAIRIIDPAPADSPAVAFPSGRTADSLTTGANGLTAATIRGVAGRTVPDRAVVEINAYRASGERIPGSGRRIVIRFRHQ